VNENSSGAIRIPTEPLRLKELVAYQEGAVVSRTLVNEKGGTVTGFAFDEGQGLSEHTAPFNALVIAIEGMVDIRISGKNFQLNEGEMIIMPSNKPHALKAVTRFKMILVMIKPE
jgi:quercetin dioxygenase-like cupin family protein